MTDTIAIGFDDSDTARVALRWAIQEAHLRSAALRIVIARPSVPDWPHDSAEHVTVLSSKIDARIAKIRTGIDQILAESPDAASRVAIDAIEGHVTEVLIAASREAAMTVVGSHGHGPWKGVVHGSASASLAGHTAGPLVVVRSVPKTPRGLVVVGVDGESSLSAVEFALREASLRGARVRAVSAWRYPVLGTDVGSPDSAELLHEAADATVLDVVGPVAEKFPGVQVETRVDMGRAVDVLADEAADADLLVVGSRGRGGFSSLVLGSVALGVLHHCAAPVAIVPHD